MLVKIKAKGRCQYTEWATTGWKILEIDLERDTNSVWVRGCGDRPLDVAEGALGLKDLRARVATHISLGGLSSMMVTLPRVPVIGEVVVRASEQTRRVARVNEIREIECILSSIIGRFCANHEGSYCRSTSNEVSFLNEKGGIGNWKTTYQERDWRSKERARRSFVY
jgi:hypothetical protein